ncbi:MAG TPA: EscU/YscU/HrcU family type III secretion system export apparatus switch protein [Capsulimonadaceae bacterium]|jgi:flagellar biosynthesis protein
MPAIAEPEVEETGATRHPVSERTAIALRYDKSIDSAPTILATGRGYTADKIVETARNHGIPLRSDPGLAAALSQLDIGASIPPDMYRAVAEVLVWVYGLESQDKR